jgi:hypothetical protein
MNSHLLFVNAWLGQFDPNATATTWLSDNREVLTQNYGELAAEIFHRPESRPAANSGTTIELSL